jgi:site-specific recombinase XerD
MALCAIKHLFEKTLNKTMPVFNLTRQKKKNKLPSVLSRDEVKRLLEHTRHLRYRALFTIIYCCGLRLNEALNLKVNHIDSNRMTLKVDVMQSVQTLQADILVQMIVSRFAVIILVKQ